MREREGDGEKEGGGSQIVGRLEVQEIVCW